LHKTLIENTKNEKILESINLAEDNVISK